MSLYWLCYQREGKVEVVLQPSASLIGARMHVGIAKLDQGTFAEGHALDEATAARIPPNMIRKRLSPRQAKLLLDSLERPTGAKKEQKRRGAKRAPA